MRWLIVLFALAASACDSRLALYEYTRESFPALLEACRAGGAGRMELVLLAPGEPRRNPYGEYAFGYAGQDHSDVSLPNPAFWQYVDWMLKRISARGMDVAILPLHPQSFAALRSSQLTDLGRYLGRRYASYKRLVWLRPPGQETGGLSLLEEGIRSFDSRHPWNTQTR